MQDVAETVSGVVYLVLSLYQLGSFHVLFDRKARGRGKKKSGKKRGSAN